MKKLITTLLIFCAILPRFFSVGDIENSKPLLGSAVISGGGIICDGDPIPDVVISITGTAPWDITYSDGTNTTTVTATVSPYVISNGIDGTYTLVSVSDASGSSTTSGGATILTYTPITITTGINTPSCYIPCDGSINLIPSGGDGNYIYTWSSGQSLPIISGLCAGQYDLNITDGNGCFIDTSFTLVGSVLPSINIDALTFVEPLCYGSNTGSATVTASGGTATNGIYTYQWNDPSGQTSPTAVALSDGNVCVQVMDDNGCATTQCVNITEPTELFAVPDNSRTICYGDSAQIWASGSGGTPPYAINWANPALSGSGPIVVAPTFTTNYCFAVTDANGCNTWSSCVTITVTPPLQAIVPDSVVICFGDAVDLVAVGTGGDTVVNPYSFVWFDDFGNGIPSIETGDSSVATVTPTQVSNYYTFLDDGCSIADSAAITVTFTASPIFSGVSTDEIFGNDGTIDLTVSNTSGSLLFDWDNDGTGDFDDAEDLTGLSAGTYTVTIDNGCELATAIFTVSSQVSVEELLNNNHTLIYPNPSNGTFSVELENVSSIKSIDIVDIKGSIIFNKEKAFSSIEKIEIPESMGGVYYLTVRTDKGNYHKRIIVIR